MTDDIRPPIAVWVQRFPDRRNLMLQWHDPITGKRLSRSAKTSDPEKAEKAKSLLESRLNLGLAPSEVEADFSDLRKYLRSIRLVEFTEEVYFIRQMPYGPIKIGVTDWPERRLSRLQTGNPNELAIVGRMPGNGEAPPRWQRRDYP